MNKNNLHLFWINFLQCENDDLKKKWLELFIYEYHNQFINNHSTSDSVNVNEHRYLLSAPSQLSCYLLELVYSLICESISTETVQNNITNNNNNNNNDDIKTDTSIDDNNNNSCSTKDSKNIKINEDDDDNSNNNNNTNDEKYSFEVKNHPVDDDVLLDDEQNNINWSRKVSQQNVTSSNDITTIDALREFLMTGIGGRILETLEKMNTKHMTCTRDFVNLLLNLFPTRKWTSQLKIEEKENPNKMVKSKIDDFQNLFDIITSIEFTMKSMQSYKTKQYFNSLSTTGNIPVNESCSSTSSTSSSTSAVSSASNASSSSSASSVSATSVPIMQLSQLITVQIDSNTTIIDNKINDINNSKLKEYFDDLRFQQQCQLQILTVDRIASIILNLIGKIIYDEQIQYIDDDSAVTVQSLKLSMDHILNIDQYNMAFDTLNCLKLKRKLLTIIILCLKNIYSSSSSFATVSFPTKIISNPLYNNRKSSSTHALPTLSNELAENLKSIFSKFLDIFQRENQNFIDKMEKMDHLSMMIKLDYLNGLIFGVFYILYIAYQRNTEQFQLYQTVYDELKLRLTTVIETIQHCIRMTNCELMNNKGTATAAANRPHQKYDQQKIIIQTLCKLIHLFKCDGQHQLIKNKYKKKHQQQHIMKIIRKKRKHLNGNKHYFVHHPVMDNWDECNTMENNYVCALEKLLITFGKSIQNMNSNNNNNNNNLKLIYKFFHNNPLCCCNCDYEQLNLLLNNSKLNNIQMHCLNFIKTNYLQLIYMSTKRNNAAIQNTNENNNNNTIKCRICDNRQFAMDNENKLITLYCEWLNKLDTMDVIMFLKHLSSISTILSNSMIVKLLQQIILPTFYKYKLIYIMADDDGNDDNDNDNNDEGEDQNNHRHRIITKSLSFRHHHHKRKELLMTKEIINYCLKLLYYYLKDSACIMKIYFIKENIQHLSDLYGFVEFANLISILFKIGIMNVQHFGESAAEQLEISKMLYNIQMTAVQNISDILMILFSDLKLIEPHVRIKEYLNLEHIDLTNTIANDNMILKQIQLKKYYSMKNILHLGIIYWNLILQLYRKNTQFKIEFQQIIAIHNKNIIGNLIYNSLSCFLSSILIEPSMTRIKKTQSSSQQQQSSSSSVQKANIDAGGNNNNNELNLSSITENTTNQSNDFENDFYIISMTDLNYLETFELTKNINNNTNTINCELNCDSLILGEIGNWLNKKSTILKFNTAVEQPKINCTLNYEYELTSSLIVQNNFPKSTINLFENYHFNENNKNIFNDIHDDEWIQETKNITNLCGKNNYKLIHDIRDYFNLKPIRKIQNNDNTNDILTYDDFKTDLPPNEYNILNVPIDRMDTDTNTDELNSKLNFETKNTNNNNNNKTEDGIEENANNNNKIDNQSLNRNVLLMKVFTKDEIHLLFTNEHKKLLIQLFEITLSILLTDDIMAMTMNTDGDKKMSAVIQELKLLLLLQSSNDIEKHMENGKLIIQTLQSLLKVAEMRETKLNLLLTNDHRYHNQNNQNDFLPSSTSTAMNNNIRMPLHQKDNEQQQQQTVPQQESDIEHSDNDDMISEELNYITADDGYEADAEIFGNYSETPNTTLDNHNNDYGDDDNDHDDDPHNIILSSTGSTVTGSSMSLSHHYRYRTHIVHEEICRLVVDILIDLSKKCLENPVFWIAHLTQIAIRLTAIRKSIGSSLYIIRGFTPILQSNDLRLSDFQRSILELILDINTPETLSAYLNIMASDRAPIDLLLTRLIYLESYSCRMKPSVEIEFPSVNDDSIRTTCDPMLFNEIKQIYDYHDFNNYTSSFTKATFIIPLNYINFRPWNQNGFTLTTWIEFRPSSNNILEEDEEDEDDDDNNVDVNVDDKDVERDKPPNNVINQNRIDSDVDDDDDDTENYKNSQSKVTSKCSKGCSFFFSKGNHHHHHKLHLFSIGSNKLLLSIYINGDDMNTLYFQLSIPASHLNKRKMSPFKHCSDKNNLNNKIIPSNSNRCSKCNLLVNKKMKRKMYPKTKENKENLNIPFIDGQQQQMRINQADMAIKDDEVDNNHIKKTSTNTQKPRISIRNQFNNLFSMSTTSSSSNKTSTGSGSGTKTNTRNTQKDDGNEFESFRYPLEVKGLKIPRNKWTHLSFSIQPYGKEISITITINGSEQHTVHMPWLHSSAIDKFQIISIGEKDLINPTTTTTSTVYSSSSSSHPNRHPKSDSSSSSHGGHGDKSMKSENNTRKYGFNEHSKYALSNVMLFQKCFREKEILSTLVAFGPDCINLTQCQMGNPIPNFGLFNSKKLQHCCQSDVILKALRENVIAIYSAHKSNMILGYNYLLNELNGYDATATATATIGEHLGVITFGLGCPSKYIASFQTAILLCGGLSPLIYLFARVVELSKSKITQSSALEFLLRIAHSHITLYTEFIRKDYINLIGTIIRTSKCLKGIHLLNSVLETACSLPVLIKRNQKCYIANNSSAYVVYADLLISIFDQYSNWNESEILKKTNNTATNTADIFLNINNNNERNILETLLSVLETLVREKHPYQNLNLTRLTRAKLIPTIFHFCKIHLIGTTNSIDLSKSAADSIVNIIRIFAGAPPSPDILDDIVKLLLLLHRPSDSFVTHDRLKYYFLLTVGQSSGKQLTGTDKRSNFYSMRKRSTTSFIPSSIKLLRSASFSPSTEYTSKKKNASDSTDDHDDEVDDDETRKTIPMNTTNKKMERRLSEQMHKCKRSESSPSHELNNQSLKLQDVDRINEKNTITMSFNGLLKDQSSSIYNYKKSPKFNKVFRNWKMHHQFISKVFCNNHHHRRRRQQQRLRRRRFHGHSQNLHLKKMKKGRITRIYNTTNKIDSSTKRLYNDYDIIAMDDINKIESLQQSIKDDREQLEKDKQPQQQQSITSNMTNTSLSSSSMSSSLDNKLKNKFIPKGIIAMQQGFLKLLKDFILILPDNSITEVLTHYCTLDIVLVLANHNDCNVRAAIIRLISVMCERMNTNVLNQQYLKSYYWYHLGNQIALHETDIIVIEAIAQWITGSYISIELMIRDTQIKCIQKYGMNSLLAIIPKISLQDLNLTTILFEFLNNMYLNDFDCRSYLIEIGLLPAITKCLQNFYIKWNRHRNGQSGIITMMLNNDDHHRALKAIEQFLCTIGQQSILSQGTISILWDLLNGFSYSERSSSSNNSNNKSFINIRSSHAIILNYLLKLFFKNGIISAKIKFDASRFEFTEDCSLSYTERKLRFDLLIDRIIQFIKITDPAHLQSEEEIRLIENMINLSLIGYSRSCNVIPWALCPSRPMSLKWFTIQTLWKYTKKDLLPTITLPYDIKIVRTLVHSMLLTHQEILSESDLIILKKVCNSLAIVIDGNCNLTQVLERLENMRDLSIKEQKPGIERSVHKFDGIAKNCIETAMNITRNVVELQNTERRLLMNYMRSYDETELIKEWSMIINSMTHEGAPWHSASDYPKSWKLDQTEGPTRVRNRFKRCQLDINPKFLLPDSQQNLQSTINTNDKTIKKPLSYLMHTLIKRPPNFSLINQVLYTFSCKYIAIDKEIDGEMIITESHLIFVESQLASVGGQRRDNTTDHDDDDDDDQIDDDNSQYGDKNTPMEMRRKKQQEDLLRHQEQNPQVHPLAIELNAITDIWHRRYQHQEIAYELFLDTNQSKLFVLKNRDDRLALNRFFTDKIIQNPDQSKLNVLIQQWKEGQLTNWEYLTYLNLISGRTYQDLMQYPVYPWILADYKSDQLDLTDPECFRDLAKPIAVQNKESENQYILNYAHLEQRQCETQIPQMEPYHYGSLYSNTGVVLQFLVRVLPYTKMFLQYQDNNFDIPDRTFHSLATTWCLVSKESKTDVKELIPEFFYLPEVFENLENYNFGCRQRGERVHDVILPEWCNNSARQFILIHRQALESQIVRQHLHKWIDLVFGYKQNGKPALDVLNVFHPSTYIGFTTSNVTDPVEKRAMETMIKTYGQTPRQLLKYPHPDAILHESNNPNKQSIEQQILPTVIGLKWGILTGSKDLPDPKPSYIYQQYDILFSNLISLNSTNVVYGIPKGYNVMQGNEPDTMNLIAWQELDGIVRIKKFSDDEPIQSDALIYNYRMDEITACGTDPHSTQLWFGHRSGRLTVYECTQNLKTQYKFNKFRYQSASAALHLTDNNKMSYNSAFGKSMSMQKNTMRKISDNEGSLASSVLDAYKCDCTLKWKEPIVLIKHCDEITGICISKEFSIVVTISKDGNATIWDYNNQQYIRSIERPSICKSSIELVTVSPTLGDIITVHSIVSTTNMASGGHAAGDDGTGDDAYSECSEATENSDDFIHIPMKITDKSLMRLHTINGRYINHTIIKDKILSVCYSYVKEGTGINVIATGYENGCIRLWSSWDLSLLREIFVGSTDVIGLIYSTYQHLIILTSDNTIQVWESPGLLGNTPKFPQLVFKKRNSI